MICISSARVPHDRLFRVPPQRNNTNSAPSSVIDDISPLNPLLTPSTGCPPLPFCYLLRQPFLNSWTICFISTKNNNKLVKTIGPTTLLRVLIATIPLVSCLLRPLLQHLVRGSMFPLNRITDTNTISMLSSVARDLMLINFLPLVHLVSSVPQHFLIAYSLTNSTRYRTDRQIVPSRSLRRRPSAMAWCLKDAVSSANTPISTNGVATQSTAVKVLVDRRYAPVPARAVARAKSGTCPMS